MKRFIDYTADHRTVHIPFKMVDEPRKTVIPFMFRQRSLSIPMTIIAVRDSRTLRMALGTRVLHIPFAMELPDNTEIIIMTLGDLDRITLGTLDPFQIPDVR